MRIAAATICVFVATAVAGSAHAADDLPVGGTHVGTTLFLDATHIDQSAKGRHDARGSGNGADLKRLYFILDHRFSDVWSAHLLTDVNWLRHADPTHVWVKYAYLEGAFKRGFVLRVGAAPTPWIALVNQWYGYRYVEKDLLARSKFGTSADWGVHVLGTLGAAQTVSYAAAAISGAGFKQPRLGNGPDYVARVAWQPFRHLVLAFGGYAGTLAQDVDGRPDLHTARRWDAMLAWADARWRLGAQYFRASDWNQVSVPQSDHSQGWSAWASVQLTPRVAVFARHDRFVPSAWLAPGREDDYGNAGVEWRPQKWLRLAAVYKHERLSLAGASLKTSNEIGLWSQLSF